MGAGAGSTGLFGIGLSQGSPPQQRFDLSQAFAGAANLEPSAESLSAQLLLQRMSATAQDIATQPAAPPSGVGMTSAGSQGDTTADTFDRLIEKSSVFRRRREEQKTDFNKLKGDLDTQIPGISQVSGASSEASQPRNLASKISSWASLIRRVMGRAFVRVILHGLLPPPPVAGS